METSLIKDELFLSSETVSLPRKVVPSLLRGQMEILSRSIPVNQMCESHWSAPEQQKAKRETALGL